MKTNCPHCGHVHDLEENLEGELCYCSECSEVFTVPSRDKPAPRPKRPVEAEIDIRRPRRAQDRAKAGPRLGIGFQIFVGIFASCVVGLVVLVFVFDDSQEDRKHKGIWTKAEQLEQRRLFEDWERDRKELTRLRRMPRDRHRNEIQRLQDEIRRMEREGIRQWGQRPEAFKELPPSDDPYYNEKDKDD